MKTLFRLTLSLLLLLSGCGVFFPSWDLPNFEETGIVPEVGYYHFVTDKDITDINHRGFSFEIVVEDEQPKLIFSSDQYRYDGIGIIDGAFRYTWGNLGGDDCPTDSYGISGHFINPKQAEGIIKTAYDGSIVATATFTATWMWKPYEP